MKRPSLTWIFTFLFLTVSYCYAFFYLNALKHVPLAWDEVDYANAVRQGVVANITEKGSMHLAEFYAYAQAKKNKNNLALSELVKILPEEKKDPFNLRHLHPPAPVFYWSAITGLIGGDLTVAYRLSNILLAWILVASIFIALWIAGRTKAIHFFYGSVLSVLLFSSSAVLHSFSVINFHTFHLIACILFCGIWIRFLEHPQKNNEALLGFGLALLFCTLEMSFITFGAVILSLLLSVKRTLLLNVKLQYHVGAWFIGFLMIFWPGVFFTGGPLKSMANYIYRIFLNKNDEYVKVSYLQNWIDLIRSNEFYFLFLLFAAIFFLFNYRKIYHPLKSILLMGVIYLIVITPFMLYTSYILPGIGIIGFGAVVMFADYSYSNPGNTFVRKLQPVVIFLSVTALLVFYYQIDFAGWKKIIKERDYRERQDWQDIQNYASTGYILANGADILNFYLADKRFVDLAALSKTNPDFGIRENYHYRNLHDELVHKKYPAIVLLQWINYSPEKLKMLEGYGYVRKNLNTHILFYLPR